MDIMQNKRTSSGKIAAFTVGLCLVGSAAVAGLVPAIPEVFAVQGGAQSTSGARGPHVPQISFQQQNGIPLGPPYGNNPMWKDEGYLGVAVALGALVVGIGSVVCFARGKSIPFLKI